MTAGAAQDRTFALQRLVVRTGMTILASLSCGLAGATVIKTVVDADHQACGRLLSMIKAAGVTAMTDEQLCDFRFSQLPPSKTNGVSFPHWVEIPVADGPAMYFRLLEANVPPKATSMRGYPWPQQMAGARQAAADKNLAFSKAYLKIEGTGEPVTFVQMDIKRCSAHPYMEHMAFPYYAVFRGEGFQHPWPVSTNLADPKQIALWKNNIPVEISIDNRWVDAGNGLPVSIGVSMQGLAGTGLDGPFHGAIDNYPVCQFNIMKVGSKKELRPD